MAQPYDETLGFPALMITVNKINLLYATLINVTHSTLILLISSVDFTINLQQLTEHSATINP